MEKIRVYLKKHILAVITILSIVTVIVFTIAAYRMRLHNGVNATKAAKEYQADQFKIIENSDGSYSISAEELCEYLTYYETDSFYMCAEITMRDLTAEDAKEKVYSGDAKVQWQSFDSPEYMDKALFELRKSASGQTGDEIRMIYYRCRMPDDVHAIELYQNLADRYSNEDTLLQAWSMDNGTKYSISQKIQNGDGSYRIFSPKSAINIVVDERMVYGLSVTDMPKGADYDALGDFMYEKFACGFCENSDFERMMDEENLYWLDHVERITKLTEPDRSFMEIRGINEYLYEDAGFMQYFGLLQKADYELPISDDGQMLSIHFLLVGDIPETGYRTDLVQGFCSNESYNMIVVGKGSGQILQQTEVDLCIELPDTITFDDLNSDGFTDMFIDMPLHSNDTRAAAEEQSWWYHPDYMLWNNEKEQFEYKTQKQVKNSLLANQNNLTEEEQDEKTKRERADLFAVVTHLPKGTNPDDYIELTLEQMEYTVQAGDTLWGISECLLGEGSYWTRLQRPDKDFSCATQLMAGEKIYVPETVVYIPRYKYSRGGLKSEGSFQIEQPDGFDYRILNTDVVYDSWAEENMIYYFPVTNEMGENALSSDWEAFKAEAARCSEEICQGRVSNLQFERYKVKGGCDLYGYSFEYDTGSVIIEYTDFIRLGASNMVEVIGVRKKEPNKVLLNSTRYIAASFIDYGGKPGMGWGDDIGSNVGAEDWDYPLLHNLFTAAEKQFGAKG